MIKSCFRSWLLIAMALLSITTAHGGTTAQTDLASITVTPLARQTGTQADWQTIYDYAGGPVVPPGTSIATEGKWIDPPIRKDQSGVTFSFPDLPDQPEAAQSLRFIFAYNRPVANYPTRATISYTSFFDNSVPGGEWSPFLIKYDIFNYNNGGMFGRLKMAPEAQAGRPKAGQKAAQRETSATNLPFKTVGDNTLAFSFGAQNGDSITINGKDVTDLFMRKADDTDKKMGLKLGTMRMPALAFTNEMTQLPHNKGDWLTVHSFKIEQLRPPLENSSAAAVDLDVPGPDPVDVTVEIVDAKNDSRGFLLKDTEVSPGKYHLYWDGIDQTNKDLKATTWISSGTYSFRLTTSKTAVSCVGDSDNSVPKYNITSYNLLNCSALAVSPPGPAPKMGGIDKWNAYNNADDTRKVNPADSVQMLGTAYDGAGRGLWVGADGSIVDNFCVSGTNMQHGRSLTITPHDSPDPTDFSKQFQFVSQSGHGSASTVVSGSINTTMGDTPPKTLSSPDWNRTQPGFIHYEIQAGQVPELLGPQQNLFFHNSKVGPKNPHQDNWIFRNVRLYEEGSPDPGPMTFDPAKITARIEAGPKAIAAAGANAPLTAVNETAPSPNPKPARAPRPVTITPGSVTVEDNGHAIHFKNATSINYPINYTITDKTILAFDLDVVDADRGKDAGGNGIGLSPNAMAPLVEDAEHYFNFMGKKISNEHFGISDPSLGAFGYPTYKPNMLYTDTIPTPPTGLPRTNETFFLWQPGYYGLKISEDGKFLFACNNADNRLEVRDISTDGHAIAKIPIDYPMFVTLAPDGEAGAPTGTRYIYVDSPKEGLLRIAWNLSDNTFGKPETLTPATEFAYPRGLVYNAAAGRIFVCDTFNVDRSKESNQIVIIDPKSGTVLSCFGKKGGVNPAIGGDIDDSTFTCPLTIDADSKGALWVNDYYSCQVRKYDFDPASNSLKLERTVLGPNRTPRSYYYWLPGAPPTQVWAFSDFLIRVDSDMDSSGHLTNQHVTSASRATSEGRAYAHFTKVGDHIYASYDNERYVYEQVGDGWVRKFAFGGGETTGKGSESTEKVARDAGLLAEPGKPPTDLDKAIAASGDANWKTRAWVWSDLNGDGKMEYTKDNPEFKIAFNSDLSPKGTPSTFRADGAYIHPYNEGGNKGGTNELLVVSPKIINGQPSYDWSDAKIITCTPGQRVVDVVAQDDRYYVIRGTGSFTEGDVSSLECYDESGKLLWTRAHQYVDLLSLQPLGDGMISVMNRGDYIIGPVLVLTKDGDYVTQANVRENADGWGHGALRADADTGYLGLIQTYKVTGLSTVKSAVATVNLPQAGL